MTRKCKVRGVNMPLPVQVFNLQVSRKFWGVGGVFLLMEGCVRGRLNCGLRGVDLVGPAGPAPVTTRSSRSLSERASAGMCVRASQVG